MAEIDTLKISAKLDKSDTPEFNNFVTLVSGISNREANSFAAYSSDDELSILKKTSSAKATFFHLCKKKCPNS